MKKPQTPYNFSSHSQIYNDVVKTLASLTLSIIPNQMKAFPSTDEQSLQIQGDLFAYFYFHNKFFLESGFSSPRSFHRDSQNMPKARRPFSVSETPSTEPRCVSHGGFSHRIQKNKDGLRRTPKDLSVR